MKGLSPASIISAISSTIRSNSCASRNRSLRALRTSLSIPGHGSAPPPFFATVWKATGMAMSNLYRSAMSSTNDSELPRCMNPRAGLIPVAWHAVSRFHKGRRWRRSGPGSGRASISNMSPRVGAFAVGDYSVASQHPPEARRAGFSGLCNHSASSPAGPLRNSSLRVIWDGHERV